jgi:hypothetical protein
MHFRKWCSALLFVIWIGASIIHPASLNFFSECMKFQSTGWADKDMLARWPPPHQAKQEFRVGSVYVRFIAISRNKRLLTRIVIVSC